MKTSIFALLALVILNSTAAAQPDGYVEVPILEGSPAPRIGCIITEGHYTRDKLDLARRHPNCRGELANLKLDPDARTLVFYRAASDCHMRVAIRTFRVDAERKYKVIINNIYGGCRAGGRRSGWITFEKMPAGYQVEMHEVMVDRIHDPRPDEGFILPSTPGE